MHILDPRNRLVPRHCGLLGLEVLSAFLRHAEAMWPFLWQCRHSAVFPLLAAEVLKLGREGRS